MAAAGIIFSNIHDSHVRELTRVRTLGSVPFGCRYRLIDFTLSNMVNSNIYNVHVITRHNYGSLMGHIGSGKDWDLARHAGGVKLLPPLITAFDNGASPPFETRLSALKDAYHAIARIRDEFVVLSDCDVICNVDLNDMINDHIASGAEMTLAVKRMHLTPERAATQVLFSADEAGWVTDVLAYPKDFSGEAEVSLNILVLHRDMLREIVRTAISHGHESLTKDVILRNVGQGRYRVYRYEGYFAAVSSMADYFRCNMELIYNAYARNALFGVKNRPIYTKVRNSTPTYYSPSSVVRNSLIADGCVIEGMVENSVLFRGVRVGRGCSVKNAILMQDTYLGEGVHLNFVVSDKNVVVKGGHRLSGCREIPYYLEKGTIV